MACACTVHTHVMENRSIIKPQVTEILDMILYIRGYYVYKVVWEITCGDVLCLEKEQ